MMKVVYQLIVLLVLVAVTWEMFTQKDIKVQCMAAMTLIPFILRLFMVV